MKAKKLIEFLKQAIELNPECECFIEGYPIGVNCDDVGDVEIYKVAK